MSELDASPFDVTGKLEKIEIDIAPTKPGAVVQQQIDQATGVADAAIE